MCLSSIWILNHSNYSQPNISQFTRSNHSNSQIKQLFQQQRQSQSQQVREIRHVANQLQSSNNSQQHSQQQHSQQLQLSQEQQVVQQQMEQQAQQESQHNYISVYFNSFSNNHKSVLNIIFSDLSTNIVDLKEKEISIGMYFEVVNYIVQEERRVNGATIFTID